MSSRTGLIDAYLDAVERFDTAAVRGCLHRGVTVVLHPNAFAPAGSTSALEEVLAGLAAGRELLASQRFSERTYTDMTDGTVLATMTWIGETAKALPGVAVGTVLTADIASRLTFEGNLLLRQENWDCYYPPQPPPASPAT